MHPIIHVSRIGRCKIDKHWRINNRTNNFWRLYCNSAPGALIESAGSRSDPGDNQIVIIPAGCTFSSIPPENPTEHLFIHFSISSGQWIANRRMMTLQIDSSLRELIGRSGELENDILRGCALVYRAISLAVPHIGTETGMEGDYSVKYILENIQTRLSVAKMAKRAGYSTDHFIRSFCGRYGTTPARYIVRLRIETAKNLLTSTDLPMEDIASMCGFNSRVHLWSTFRRETGMTPSQFRSARKIDDSTPMDDNTHGITASST